MQDPSVALPESQLYIVLAIVGTVATILSAHVRDNPNVVNLIAIRLALALVYVAAVMAAVQIMLVLWFATDPQTPAQEAYVYSHMAVVFIVAWLILLGIDATKKDGDEL